MLERHTWPNILITLSLIYKEHSMNLRARRALDQVPWLQISTPLVFPLFGRSLGFGNSSEQCSIVVQYRGTGLD
jgi:hypothetical protein